MSSAVHYRALSVTGLESPAISTVQRRTSFDAKSSTDLPHLCRKPSDHDPDPLLADAYSRRVRLPPRNYRCMRITAYLGWTFAAILFIVIVASQTMVTPAAQMPRLGLGRTRPAGGAVASQLVKGEAVVVSTLASVGEDVARATPTASTSSAGKKMAGGAQAPVTIVSSFYRVVNGKKHRVSEYHEWLTNFLHSVELPVMFYCAPSMAAYIRNLRGNKPLTLITDYSSPFEMPPLQALGGIAWAQKQFEMDPEPQWHVPEVYGVWTAKPWIVKDASERDPYRSEYFFWVDAGSFRDAQVSHDFSALPGVLEKIFSTLPRDTILLAATTIPFEEGTDWVKAARPGAVPDREDRLQGGWFGGRREAIEMWQREVRKVTVRQSAMQRFAGKEQPIWTQAARLTWRKIYVQNMALRVGPDCGPDLWFGFEYFADGRDCEIPVWNGPEYAQIDAEQKQYEREGQHVDGELLGGGDEVGQEGLMAMGAEAV
ncbi:hypothetical protein JCM1840_007487 [Sporobolomyces johnsonii]